MSNPKSQPSRKTLKRLRRKITGMAIIFLVSFLGFLPFAVTSWLLVCFSQIAFFLLKSKRERALTHLKQAFQNEKTDLELRKIARQAFRNYGRSTAELIHLRHPEKLLRKVTVEIEGEENFKEALNRKKGVVSATAHFGNWELMAATVSRLGYKANAVARSMQHDGFDRWLNDTRRLAGVNVIKRGKADLELFRCLRRNELLGILYDLDTQGPGIFVDFFGAPVFTQTGPVLLSLRTGATIVVSLIHREGKRKHKIVVYPPLEYGQGCATEEEKVRDGLNKLNQILEQAIREHPTEWAWLHRRWRHTQP